MKVQRATPRMPRSVLAALAAVPMLVGNATNGATRTWTGSVSANWSDRFNWSSSVLPVDGDALVFRTSSRTQMTQNLSPSFTASGITFGTISFPTGTFQFSGNPVVLSPGASITNQSPSLQIFRNEVQLAGAATFNTVNSTAGYPTSVALLNVTGPGNLNVVAPPAGSSYANCVLMPVASYTGTTTVHSGILRVGGQFNVSTSPGSGYEYYVGRTGNQGDYTVLPGAVLAGGGTIGLASQGRITVAGGKLAPGWGSGLGVTEDGGYSIVVEGDVVFGDGGMFESREYVVPVMTAKLRVTGTLDLQSQSDQFRWIRGWGSQGVNELVATYGNRLGEFDVITGVPSDYRLVYTSAENSGPGEVWLMVPEPGSLMMLAPAVAGLFARRKNRSCPHA